MSPGNPVALHLGGTPAPDVAVEPPRRHRLSKAALDELARRTRTPLPWHGTATGSAAARGLDARPGSPEPTADPVAELVALGLVSPDGAQDTHVVGALAAFARPETFVDLELGHAGGRFRAWHRHRHTRVVAVSRSGDEVELAWWAVEQWPAELARLVTPPSSVGDPGPSPAAYLRLPYELLLGSGAALRLRRPAVLAELLARHHGRVTGGDARVLGTASAAEQVRLVHGALRGRLRVTVAGVEGDGSRTVGLLTWVLFSDGWRELLPAAPAEEGAGEPMVVVHAVAPADLGGRVARMVAGARVRRP